MAPSAMICLFFLFMAFVCHLWLLIAIYVKNAEAPMNNVKTGGGAGAATDNGGDCEWPPQNRSRPELA